MTETAPVKTPDPTKNYRVKLSRAVEITKDIWARPADDVVLRGDFIAEHGDAIISFEEA